MQLELVHRRNDSGLGSDLLKFELGAIRYANGADFSLFDEGFELSPSVGEVPVMDDVANSIGEEWEEGVVSVRIEMDGPMNEVDYRFCKELRS
jgi:hypothetical protein